MKPILIGAPSASGCVASAGQLVVGTLKAAAAGSVLAAADDDGASVVAAAAAVVGCFGGSGGRGGGRLRAAPARGGEDGQDGGDGQGGPEASVNVSSRCSPLCWTVDVLRPAPSAGDRPRWLDRAPPSDGPASTLANRRGVLGVVSTIGDATLTIGQPGHDTNEPGLEHPEPRDDAARHEEDEHDEDDSVEHIRLGTGEHVEGRGTAATRRSRRRSPGRRSSRCRRSPDRR